MTGPHKDDVQRSVHISWRPTLAAIVRSLVERASTIAEGLPVVDPVPADVREQCLRAIDSYGDVDLAPLPDETWTSSVSMWQGDHWLCLIDLWTERDGRSDLVLRAEVREAPSGYRYSVDMVYVP